MPDLDQLERKVQELERRLREVENTPRVMQTIVKQARKPEPWEFADLNF